MLEIYKNIVTVLCEHRIINQISMACMQAIGFDGFALMHKCRAKDMQCFELDIIYNYFSVYRNKFIFPTVSVEYEPVSLKEHLAMWKIKLDDAVCGLRGLHKQIMDGTGAADPLVVDIIDCMECDYKMAESLYKRFVATSWLVHDQYTINDRLAAEYREA